MLASNPVFKERNISELNKLDVKLCSKQYYKIDLIHWIAVSRLSGGAGNITTQNHNNSCSLWQRAVYVFPVVYG
jgi:hypothetical protein